MELKFSKEKIIEIYNKEKSIGKTAKILGISHPAVKKYMNLYKIQQEPLPEIIPIPSKEKLEELYLKFGSFLKIEKETKINAHRISKYFYEYELDKKYPLKHTCDYDFFSRDTEESWYWAGFIAADGSIDRNTVLDIGLCSKDIKHLKKFKEHIKTTSEIKLRPPATKLIKNGIYKGNSIHIKEVCRLMVASKKIISDLKRWNIVPTKSLIYSLPENLLTHPMIRHFVRGIIDGDGCWIENKKNRFRLIMTGTKRTCEQIFEIFLINKLIPSNYKCNVRKINHSKAYSITFSSHQSLKKIRDYLYKDTTIFLERKYEIASKIEYLSFDEKFPKPDPKLIEEFYKQDRSIRRISKKLNISRDRIQKSIIENNIEHNVHRKNDINHNFFENKNVQNFHYWFGYFFGKMCIENNVTVVLHDSIEKLQLINNLLNSTYQINKNELKFNSTKFIKDFYNLIDNIFNELNNIENISKFLLGYIESRGYFIQSKNKPFRFADKINKIQIIEKILEIINIKPINIKIKKLNKLLIFNYENTKKLFIFTNYKKAALS